MIPGNASGSNINGKNATNCGMVKVQWKRWFSYLWPIREQGFSSENNPELELRWESGTLVLNAARANYSYGSLHEVMKVAINALSCEDLQNLLLLGMGGGSACKIAQQKCGSTLRMTAVDIDPVVLKIAQTAFQIHESEQIRLVEADAFLWVNTASDEAYSAIIEDLFIDVSKPDFLLHRSYIRQLYRILKPGGVLLINIMSFEESYTDEVVHAYREHFTVARIQPVHQHNRLLFLRKTG
jgi:spermidine synthase